jgi:hypothetical protein
MASSFSFLEGYPRMIGSEDDKNSETFLGYVPEMIFGGDVFFDQNVFQFSISGDDEDDVRLRNSEFQLSSPDFLRNPVRVVS